MRAGRDLGTSLISCRRWSSSCAARVQRPARILMSLLLARLLMAYLAQGLAIIWTAARILGLPQKPLPTLPPWMPVSPAGSLRHSPCQSQGACLRPSTHECVRVCARLCVCILWTSNHQATSVCWQDSSSIEGLLFICHPGIYAVRKWMLAPWFLRYFSWMPVRPPPPPPCQSWQDSSKVPARACSV